MTKQTASVTHQRSQVPEFMRDGTGTHRSAYTGWPTIRAETGPPPGPSLRRIPILHLPVAVDANVPYFMIPFSRI